jgi:hypothetical protein
VKARNPVQLCYVPRVYRLAVLVALVGCEDREPTAPPVAWTYAPPPAAWPIGELRGRIGRSQPPQQVTAGGVEGQPPHGLTMPSMWSVPGEGPARAIVAGRDGGKPAVELVEIDPGRVVWRDMTACAAPVVGVTSAGAICADVHGTRTIGFDGKPRWQTDDAFVALTGDRVVLAPAAGGLRIHDDAAGSDVTLALPQVVAPSAIGAVCGDKMRELFAQSEDGKILRIADDAKGTLSVAWTALVGRIAGLDACGASVLVTVATDAGTSLVALARDTGKPTGRVDGVRGYWPARDGSDRLEISTPTGVASWSRDLAGAAIPVPLPVLAELLAQRGDRRLVRATAHTAVLLDHTGVRADVPLAELGAVLGDDHVLAASWLGSPGATVRRFALPPPLPRVLRVPARTAGIGVPAELRDLPRVVPLDLTHAIASGAASAVGGVMLDPASPHVVYAIGDRSVARADLATRAWTWRRDGACGDHPVALAIARDVIVCGSREGVRATATDGTPRWDWASANVDTVAAAGDLVLAFDADRLAVLDAGDGHVLAHFASDDGDAMRAAVLDVAGTPLIVTAERGRLIARLPRAAFLPVWSLEVDGAVRALSPVDDGVLVVLDDGDAYLIDARTADAVALPGIGLAWHAEGDVIAGATLGEQVPPAVMPVPAPVIPKPRPKQDSPENPPPIATPWPAPPPPGPPSWQQQLFELTGRLRARNDYALPPPIAAAWPRGPVGSPLVVAYGPGTREALVIDAARGDPVRRVQLPADAPAGTWFATVVDGKPVAGVVLPNPLRIVLF